MDSFFTNRLYNLSINNFYNYSFFYFFIFSLQRNYYYLLQKENIKITYFNSNEDLFINKKNKVYIIYNYLKSEIFSLPKIFYLLNNNNENIDLNVCLSFNSILYTNYYYIYNIRWYYYNIIKFLKMTHFIFLKYKKMYSLYNNFFFNNNNLIILFVNFYLYKKLFNNRFFIK